MHGGAELPTDTDEKARELFLRTALGMTFATDRGFGRAWSPQVEVLWARPEGGEAEWDVVPQVQVTLSKLQHVALAAGVRIPLTERENAGRSSWPTCCGTGSTAASWSSGDDGDGASCW